MLTLRPASERGGADYGWLRTRHTFSFASYYDPRHMGFRSLRVLNEDRVAPRGGFPTHPHRDMEIVSYVLSGALEHKDSTGSSGVLRPGEVQRMTAGRGVVHSEYNASAEDPLHFLQIWLLPERPQLEPGYEQRAFADEERRARWCLLASPNGADNSLTIHQDALLFGTVLQPAEEVVHELGAGRGAWLHLARGSARINGVELHAGDGVAVEDEQRLVLTTDDEAEALLFDLGEDR
jgi:redox-sensitive bicupin YhaK (pirin superfamily)